MYKHDTLEAVDKTRIVEDLDRWIAEEDVRWVTEVQHSVMHEVDDLYT